MSFEARRHFCEYNYQTMLEYRSEVQYAPQPQQLPRHKTPALYSASRIQVDDWVKVSGKGKGKAKTFT